MSPLYRAFPDASFIFSALTLRMTPFGKRDWDIDTLKSRPCWPQQCKGLILKKREEWEVEVSILGYTSSISLYLSVHICVFKYLTLYFVLSHFSRVRLFATPWTVARQVPLSMGFPRQEYWSGLSFPPPGADKQGPLPAFVNKALLADGHAHLSIVYDGCFHTTRAEFSHCDGDHLAHKALNSE